MYITIDDPSARDLDDAISFVSGKNTMTLSVHITNVPLLIDINSEIFAEAASRIETIYGKEVINMIPDRMANDELSLIAGKERNVITVSIPYHFGENGWIKGRSIIRREKIVVEKRLSYEEADMPKNEKYVKGLIIAHDVWMKEGKKTGRVEDIPTRSYYFAEDGTPAIKMNEEKSRSWISVAMKLANIEVARYIGVFTINRDTTDDKQFRTLVRAAGLSGSYKRIYDNVIPNLKIPISQRDPRRGKGIIVIGKGFDCQIGDVYTKFTSPIRRFSDLIVQYILNAKLDEKPCPFTTTELQQYADNINNFRYPRDDTAKEAYLQYIKFFNGIVVLGHHAYIKVFIPHLNIVLSLKGSRQYGQLVTVMYEDQMWTMLNYYV